MEETRVCDPMVALEMMEVYEKKDNCRESWQGDETKWNTSFAARQEDHGGFQGGVRAGGILQEGHSSVCGNVVRAVGQKLMQEGKVIVTHLNEEAAAAVD